MTPPPNLLYRQGVGKVTDEVIDARLDMITPGHCSTLIYTSGTTGPPKVCPYYITLLLH